jgi:anti-sigma factor RsiW
MMMTCREVRDFLAEYASGGLSISDRRDFENHLAVCSECEAHVRSSDEAFRLSQLALCDLADPSPNEVPESLLRDIVDLQNQPDADRPASVAPAFGASPFSNTPIRADRHGKV